MLANTLFIGGIGPWEIMIILLVALIVFGGRKIPELAKDLGTGIREFRKSLSGAATDISDTINDENQAGKRIENSKAPSKKKSKSSKRTTKS